ncbi:MAG: HDOD domain-containing protein [Deltaproteobacteria bacterium]|nr:HDOD domain-containing protein [Deltaproteobacteria bacterium]
MRDSPTSTEERLRQIQNYISRMPSLSTTVTKVLEVCNRPDTSPNDLNRVISLDPVLTGRVLKLINSAYYALPNQITSLTRAIIMLGLNTVKNLALSTAILQSVGGEDEFWTHSITVGVTAKSLSVLKGVPVAQREEYFVAGLLHDLGKIPLNNRFPEEYTEAREMVQKQGALLFEAEEGIFGMDHCAVGGMIAEKWELSGVLNDTLVRHHRPETALEENRPLVFVVALANTYTGLMERGDAQTAAFGSPQLSFFLRKVGVSDEVVHGLRDTVQGEIERAKVFLQVAKHG